MDNTAVGVCISAMLGKRTIKVDGDSFEIIFSNGGYFKHSNIYITKWKRGGTKVRITKK